MADIRCPSCGKNNPDFLDHCQFCQSPLKPESLLRAGESPTKKNTGELQSVLPQWLREVQQQSQKSAEENAAQEAAQPKIEKKEPPDLLAGLASQAGSDNDDIPDWLASIRPAAEAKSSETRSAESDPSIGQEDRLSQLGEPEEKDDLSEWFSQASQQPSQPFTLEPGQDDSDLLGNLDSSAGALGASLPPAEEEDLGWLRDLEASAKQSAEPSVPRRDLGRMPDDLSSQPFSGEQDLSWLNNLGGISESFQQPSALDEPGAILGEPQDKSASAEPFASQEDLSWLDNIGKTEPLQPPQPAVPSAAQDDLSWLDNLGGTEPLQPPPPLTTQDDLNWLDNLGQTSELSKPEPVKPSSQDDLSRPNNSSEKSDVEEPVSPFLSPRATAPLNEDAKDESVPDWLKSATEEPSMPPLGAGALNWFASHNLDENQPAPTQESSLEEVPGLSEEAQPRPLDQPDEMPAFTPTSETPPASDQDVDSLFSMNVPDWLSNPEPSASDVTFQETETSPAVDAESLAPVDLPSWVQAMRPVEAVISDTSSGTEDQAPEREGPLAGLSGVIPLLPIGSSRRPKALSLTLQTTDEQQAGAALFEEILAGETAPRPIPAPSSFTSQSVLRWILTALIVLVLGAMIGLRSQSMPVPTALPVAVAAASNAIAGIPENAPLLVILDYEPSLTGELEAVSGPLLSQVVLSRHPNLSFLSTSPNGAALVQRLMTNIKIDTPSAGEQYINLGYLPGGSAGVLTFVESPQTAVPAAGFESFSQYSAVILLTDHAESARVWVEQLDARKRNDASLASQPLLIVASAQAGPLLQPYASSGQVAGMISGLADAARYESVNNIPSGIARTYWDAFGIGLLLAIILITFGSLWSLFIALRPRRAGAE